MANEDFAAMVTSNPPLRTSPRIDGYSRLSDAVVRSLQSAGARQEHEYDGLNRRIVRRFGTIHTRSMCQSLRLGPPSPTTTTYLHDANFNVTAVADDQGTVVERYAYTPYGEATILNGASDFGRDRSAVDTGGSDILNEYLYTGRRLDPETGLQLNRNRFYASHLGRWVNRDPIGYDGSWMNLYNYVTNRPSIALDPWGLVPTCAYCECEAENKRRTWVIEKTCNITGRYLLQDCCSDACWDAATGFGHPIEIRRCDSMPTEECTAQDASEDSCDRSDCERNCNRKWGWACTVACTAAGNTPCYLLCWAGYEACMNDCSKCPND